MNKYIEELVNGWGLGTDTHVITAIIILMSVITMCAVFWLIFHLVSPKSSHFREMCFKVIICTTAVLLVITTFVSIGGNVVIREELVTKENNANIRTSSIEPMQLYDESNPAVNNAITSILNGMGADPNSYNVYATTYNLESELNIGEVFIRPVFIKGQNSDTIYEPYTYQSEIFPEPLPPIYGLMTYVDPLSDSYELIGGKALVISDAVYILVALPKSYTPYECKQYNGQPVIIEVNPKMPYDPDFD